MFITLEADYAVRIVSVLCREKDKMDAKTISNDACVTLRFALKILRKLVAPWKYQALADEMMKIHEEDQYNDCYGRERMYLALQHRPSESRLRPAVRSGPRDRQPA